MVQPSLVKVEFHCHTVYSKDSLVTIESLVKFCHKKSIDRLVITDHNNIQGALIAHQQYPQLFIVGEEVMTEQGELLAFFVKEEVPGGLPPYKAIELLRDQGAFISVSHPFDAIRAGRWRERDLLEILPQVDAIEVFNSRCLHPNYNLRALVFSQQHHLLGTVGSDSHSLGEVGHATLTLPDFHDAPSLKYALTLAEPHVHLSGFWVHFHSRYAKWHKRLVAPQ